MLPRKIHWLDTIGKNLLSLVETILVKLEFRMGGLKLFFILGCIRIMVALRAPL